jgi:3-hydroxymyristoyl/3-hydroxydecanoyl-(acyl carrier protein) dehydratase
MRGSIDVDPQAWFFKAHFYQDPVWSGSLGLESFLQLLKVYAAKRWSCEGGRGKAEGGREISFLTTAPRVPHEWIYRGQVIPADKTVTVEAVITAVDDQARQATASGYLSVDGRLIYQMSDFTVQIPVLIPRQLSS